MQITQVKHGSTIFHLKLVNLAKEMKACSKSWKGYKEFQEQNLIIVTDNKPNCEFRFNGPVHKLIGGSFVSTKNDQNIDNFSQYFDQIFCDVDHLKKVGNCGLRNCMA